MTYYSFATFGNCWKCRKQFEFDHSKTPPDVNYCNDEDCIQPKLNPEIRTKCKDCSRTFKQIRANKEFHDTCQFCRKNKPKSKKKQKKKVKRKNKKQKKINLG